MTQKKTIGTTKIDSRSVYERLKNMIPGEAISYQELSDLTGRDIIRQRYILNSARNMALRDNIVFDVIHNFGIKRLTDNEIVQIESVRPLSKCRSALKNGIKRITCAKEISNEERIQVNASLSLFGVIAEFTKPKAVDNIINKNTDAEQLSFQNIVMMFDPTNKLSRIEQDST